MTFDLRGGYEPLGRGWNGSTIEALFQPARLGSFRVVIVAQQ
jgi:hypothetical protein